MANSRALFSRNAHGRLRTCKDKAKSHKKHNLLASNVGFSQENLVQSPWADLKNAINLREFSIHGDSRMFEISDRYGGCPHDSGWFLITEHHCDWERRLRNASILYSKLDGKVIWKEYGMKNAPT